MSSLARLLLVVACAAALSLTPCASLAATPERCGMGDCDEPAFGAAAPCCCASPASPSGGSTTPVGRGESSAAASHGQSSAAGAVTAATLSPRTAPGDLPAALTGAPPDRFLLNASFRI